MILGYHLFIENSEGERRVSQEFATKKDAKRYIEFLRNRGTAIWSWRTEWVGGPLVRVQLRDNYDIWNGRRLE